MSYNKFQFKNLIERATKELNLYSTGAVELLLGTAAQESGFGTYLRQLGGGPARGAYQMEPFTFLDLQTRYAVRFPMVKSFMAEQLEYDLRCSIIMARIKYFSCPGAVPKDLSGQAWYWKIYYNSELGAGTVEEYLTAYRKYVV